MTATPFAILLEALQDFILYLSIFQA